MVTAPPRVSFLCLSVSFCSPSLQSGALQAVREARERASGSTNLLHKHLIADERLIVGPLAASQGLFDNNATLLYVDAARQQATLNQPASRELARKVAEEGITLLTNKEKRLPLMGLGSAPLKTIAVLGPNADNPHSTLGLYGAEPGSPGTVTVLQAAAEAANASGGWRSLSGLLLGPGHSCRPPPHSACRCLRREFT